MILLHTSTDIKAFDIMVRSLCLGTSGGRRGISSALSLAHKSIIVHISLDVIHKACTEPSEAVDRVSSVFLFVAAQQWHVFRIIVCVLFLLHIRHFVLPPPEVFRDWLHQRFYIRNYFVLSQVYGMVNIVLP